MCAAAAKLRPSWLDRPREAKLIYSEQRMEVTVRELIGRSIFCNGVFEFPVTLFIRTALRPGDIFLDVGANAGYHSLGASAAVGSSGKVLAFEPAPDIRARLQRNIELNAIRNVIVSAEAVSSVSDRVQFFVSDNPENSGLSSLRQRGGPQHVIDVQTTTLDLVCSRLGVMPALVKIDVEGAEAEVFKGGQATLGAVDAPCLVFEAYAPMDAELAATLQTFGYEVRQLAYLAGRIAFLEVGSQVWHPFDFDAPTFVAAKPGWRGKGLRSLGELLRSPFVPPSSLCLALTV